MRSSICFIICGRRWGEEGPKVVEDLRQPGTSRQAVKLEARGHLIFIEPNHILFKWLVLKHRSPNGHSTLI